MYYRDLPAKIFEELWDGDTNWFAVAYASYKSGRNKDDVKRLLRDFTVSEIIKWVEMCVDRWNAHNH